jgi:hypothetical protein
MSDNLDQLIHDAFADFDAVERGSNPPVPGAAAVRRTVAHQRRMRYTMLSGLGALLIAVPVVAVTAKPHGNNSPPAGSSASPAAVASVTSPAGQASPTVGASATPRAVAVDLRDATLTLPAFPGWGSNCTAGTRKFVNGTAAVSNGIKLIIGEMAPIMADLDGVPGDEALTTLRCQTTGSVNATQLLALKPAPDGRLTALGYVVNSPDTPNVSAAFDHDNVRVHNGVVQVTAYGAYRTDGWPPCTRQVRGYAYRTGAFRQVSGPTSFTKPSKNLHQVDFRNVGVLVGFNSPGGTGARVYCVPMANGVGRAAVYTNNDPAKGATRYTFTIGTVSFLATTQGEVTFAILTYRSPSGATSQTLQSFENADSDYPLGREILRSGTGGVTRIEKAEIAGNRVRVTVSTAGGSQVWIYQPLPTDQRWQRVN